MNQWGLTSRHVSSSFEGAGLQWTVWVAGSVIFSGLFIAHKDRSTLSLCSHLVGVWVHSLICPFHLAEWLSLRFLLKEKVVVGEWSPRPTPALAFCLTYWAFLCAVPASAQTAFITPPPPQPKRHYPAGAKAAGSGQSGSWWQPQLVCIKTFTPNEHFPGGVNGVTSRWLKSVLRMNSSSSELMKRETSHTCCLRR